MIIFRVASWIGVFLSLFFYSFFYFTKHGEHFNYHM